MRTIADLVYDPYDYRIDADPHPTWQRLRDEAPLYRNDEYDFWALSRYADVLDASLDHQTFSSAHGTVLELMGAPLGRLRPMIFMDPPEHDRMRRLVSRAFTPRRVSDLEGRIRELCAAYLDPHAGGTGFDFVAEFAAKLPVMVISALLGIPEQDQDQVRIWSDTMLHRESGETTGGNDAMTAFGSMRHYLSTQLDARRTKPRDDMMSDLLHAELDEAGGTTRPLSADELHNFLALLSAAGNETVARLLSWAAVLLGRHPGERARLVAEPAMIPNAVEELLRYEAPSPVQGRWLTRDVELHGTVVPAESRVLLLTGSAGRDGRHYDDPDRFDVGRRIDRHLSFGHGAHYCLGASLARLEARVALEETLARFPTWDVDEEGMRMVHTSTVRGYESVPILLG